jgi:hypothetical protein
MEFKDGEVVFYLDEERNRMLGPFTIGIMDDGSVDLWYKPTLHIESLRQATGADPDVLMRMIQAAALRARLSA